MNEKQTILFGGVATDVTCARCGRFLTGSLTLYWHKEETYCKDHLPKEARRGQRREKVLEQEKIIEEEPAQDRQGEFTEWRLRDGSGRIY